VNSISKMSVRRFVIRATVGMLLLIAAACAAKDAPRDDGRLARLLPDRDAIWQAWFSNDSTRLEQLLPQDIVAINNGDTTWQDRAAVLAAADAFAKSGGKLVRLTFPRTEQQVFGDVAILYSRYELELELNGRRIAQSGRVTEVFVWRNGVWQNVGWHLDSGR